MLAAPKNTEEDKDEEEVTAAAEEISTAAAVATVLSGLDGIFTLKEQQQPSLKAFLDG